MTAIGRVTAGLAKAVFARSVFAVVLAASSLLAGALAAHAGIVDPVPGPGTTGTGYTVEVQVVLSGDAAPGGPSKHVKVLRMAPACWWQLASGPARDAKAMVAYVQWLKNSGMPETGKLMMGPDSAFTGAAASSTPMWWFIAQCRDYQDYFAFTKEQTSYLGAPVPIRMRAVPVVGGTATPPAPQVDPRQLAEAARDAMVIPVPLVERNPKAVGAGQLIGATFVNLPTWFWVVDPAAVGGTGGTRTIRAEVGGGAVWAQVVARTQGLQLSAPTGSTQCPPARAVLVWKPGAADTAGCTVAFPRASVAFPSGYPVATSTSWQATWTGSGATGGALPVLTRQAVVNVPVAEAQAVVTALR